MKRLLRRQDGQVVVLVAIMMVALLLMVALAVDVGNLYGARRRMQNAADAGALAGARELCFGNPDNWYAAALDYAENRNGIGVTTAVPTLDGNRVIVDATEATQTFFLQLIGMNTINVPARAVAACGKVTRMVGLWPIALHKFVWDYWQNQPLSCPGDPTQPPPIFYVWNDDKTSPPDCDLYNCDENLDGWPDIIVVGGDRSWLDFSDVAVPDNDPLTDECAAAGCGANELRCHILGGNGDMVVLPACIAGDSGVKAGIANDVNARIGDVVAIPIYESVNTCNTAYTCPGGLRYWVTDFGCVTVRGWRTITYQPLEPGTAPVINTKVIEVEIYCGPDCRANVGSTDGTPCDPGDTKCVKTVSLIE